MRFSTEIMLHIDTLIVTYNAMGGHGALTFTGELLLGEAPPSFGHAVDLIEAYCHVDDSGRGIPFLLRRYHERVKTMPFATFYRKPKRIDLAFHSSLKSGNRLLDCRCQGATLGDVPMVRTVYKEMASAMEVVRDRPKPSDDFDASAFLDFIHRRVGELDRASDSTILQMIQRFRELEKQRVASR